MQFTIDRATWRCGQDGEHAHGSGATMLLNEQGFLCCLGSVSEQLGVPKASLAQKCVPAAFRSAENRVKLCPILLREVKCWGGETIYVGSDLEGDAITVNDKVGTPRAEREAELMATFKDHGHEVVFTGEYTDANAKTLSE